MGKCELMSLYRDSSEHDSHAHASSSMQWMPRSTFRITPQSQDRPNQGSVAARANVGALLALHGSAAQAVSSCRQWGYGYIVSAVPFTLSARAAPAVSEQTPRVTGPGRKIHQSTPDGMPALHRATRRTTPGQRTAGAL